MLASKKRSKSRPQVVRRMMQRIRHRPTSGSTAISVVKLGGISPIFLMGEIHDNPDLCEFEEKNDVLRDLIVYPLLNHENTVLLLEGFVKNENVTQDLQQELKRYDVQHMMQCFQSNFKHECQYRGRTPGVLNFLRWLKTSLQLDVLMDPSHMLARKDNNRIILFDIRHELRMKTPFVDWSLVKDPAEYIRQSLAEVGSMTDFMRKIPHPTWHDTFHHRVYLTLMKDVDMLRNTPTTEKYEDFFIKFPDVIALNHLLVHISQNPQCIPIVYAGDNHRQHLLALLSLFDTMEILAEAKDTNSMGSCARPRSS